MTQKPLYRSLDANLALLEEMFGRSDDFYTKRLMLAGIPCAIVMFTGLSSPEKLCRMALDMLDRDPAMLGGGEGLCDYLLTQSRVPAEPDAVEDRTALVELLSNGLSVLLIDGVRRGVAFSTQEMPQRSISTPMSEGNLRGPQEAFTELLRNNISLLRRQFRTGTLVAEISTARTRAKTEYCLCYDSTLAPKETIDALPGRLYYGLLDLAALPPGCDWADAQTLGTLLYDKAQPAPELSVFVLDTADHSWAADAASLYEDMNAVEREYDLHCGLQQLFTQADGCAVPAYRADSGYDFALLAADGVSVYVSGLQAQLAAALCGQTGRFFTAFAGGQAVCDTQVNVTAEDTTVQLHLRDTDFQPLGAYNEDWQALLCTELQQAFSALTADDAADFFHLQFWHVNLCGPGSVLPVPRLEILFE